MERSARLAGRSFPASLEESQGCTGTHVVPPAGESAQLDAAPSGGWAAGRASEQESQTWGDGSPGRDKLYRLSTVGFAIKFSRLPGPMRKECAQEQPSDRYLDSLWRVSV